jgi:hypothetical protein
MCQHFRDAELRLIFFVVGTLNKTTHRAALAITPVAIPLQKVVSFAVFRHLINDGLFDFWVVVVSAQCIRHINSP